MSLYLWVSYDDPQTGESVTVDMPSAYHLMGFDVFREQLWGTEIMTALGLELLPALGDGYIYVGREQIDQLEHEVEVIRDNLDKIRQVLDPGIIYSLENIYLRNLFNAVSIARSVGGWITIH